jgi:hypothetical protein
MAEVREDFYRQVKAQEGIVIGLSEGELRSEDGSAGTADYCLFQVGIPGREGFECIYFSDRQLASLIATATEFLATPKG